jgi:WD40 repeat protein
MKIISMLLVLALIGLLPALPVQAITTFGAGSETAQKIENNNISQAPTGLIKISLDNNPLPAFRWDTVSGASSYEIQMDFNAWVDIGERRTYIQPTVLSKGSHVFSVRAKDSHSSFGPQSSFNFMVSVVTNLSNTKIAASQGRELSSSDIYSMNIDFSERTKLTNNSASDQYPAWSPDGREIAYCSEQDGNREIYVMNQDGSSKTRITFNTANDEWPSWSPDGTKIAFQSNRDGDFEIYTANADGSELTQLTHNTYKDAAPVWSPDTTKIAFFSARDGNANIYVMNSIDGSNQTRLTENPEEDSYPDWSPNGTSIVYNARENGKLILRIMDSAGLNETNITIPSAEVFATPRWSPDGSKIVFDYAETYSGHSWTIATMNSDGSNMHVLDVSRPWGQASWSPFFAPTMEGPITSQVLASPNPASINVSVNITAIISDVDTGGSQISSGEYSLDGGPWIPMGATDGAFDEVIEHVDTSLPPFAEAGVHQVSVRGQDADDNVGQEESILLAIYDPNAGFITGGGWIYSPEGAYTADPLLAGKANFGFVSKYKKGADTPTGQTEFQFKLADLNFHSSSYQWLVVAGPHAKFKGNGTINGSGDYGFMLTATDGQESGGGEVDKFRIKIWDKATDHVVYDNKLGVLDDQNDAQEIAGGNLA